jgi:hypothetical protein
MAQHVQSIASTTLTSMLAKPVSSLPGAVTLAITSIATTLAVILIKKNLTQFCAIGAKPVA